MLRTGDRKVRYGFSSQGIPQTCVCVSMGNNKSTLKVLSEPKGRRSYEGITEYFSMIRILPRDESRRAFHLEDDLTLAVIITDTLL